MRRKRDSLQSMYICIYSNKLTEGVSQWTFSQQSHHPITSCCVWDKITLSLVSRSKLGSLFWGPWCYLMSTQTPSSEHQFVVWEDSLCFTLMGTFPLFDKLHCWHLTLWSHSTKRVLIKTLLMSNVYLTHLSNPKSQPSQSRRDQLICNSNFEDFPAWSWFDSGVQVWFL